jgi:hypothetical protein
MGMKKLSEGLDKRIHSTAVNLARHEFIEMVGPDLRGPAWKWEYFPEWCERRMEKYIVLDCKFTHKQMKDIENIIGWGKYYASQEAKSILEITKVCNWGKHVV